MLGTAFIIISIAAAVAFTFSAFFSYLRNRSNVALLKAHLKAGHPLNADAIRLVQSPSAGSTPDIRKAILLLALGLAVALFSQFMDGQENIRLVLGMSLFPVILGLGFLVSLRVEKAMTSANNS
jgi:Domain of unknown function (DUF6249)